MITNIITDPSQKKVIGDIIGRSLAIFWVNNQETNKYPEALNPESLLRQLDIEVGQRLGAG